MKINKCKKFSNRRFVNLSHLERIKPQLNRIFVASSYKVTSNEHLQVPQISMDIAKSLHWFSVDPLSVFRWNNTKLQCTVLLWWTAERQACKKINVTRSILCHRRCFALIYGCRWASAQMMNDKRASMDFIVLIHVNRNRALSRVSFMFFFRVISNFPPNLFAV